MSLIDQIHFQNHHWLDQIDVPVYRREIFHKLEESLEHKFIVTLFGTRRVGKTTLFKQFINYLIQEKNIRRKNILYFSLDLYNESLLDIVQTYEREVDIKIKEEKCFLFFDEIQYLENWASHVKLIFDNLPTTKIFISGSSSSDLYRGRESLAGREEEIILKPLNFNEFLDITRKNPTSERNRWELYLDYMDHQLPELALTKISERDYVGQLVDKIINNDFVRLHKIKDTKPFDVLFRIICKSPGEIIKLNDMAQELQLNWRTIQNYLSHLERALLIRKVYNYSKNPRKSEKRHIKYYPSYTTLHWYTYPYKLELGKKAETEVALQLDAEYFYNERGKEIDFIIGKNLNVGIEVKMRNTISYRNVKWLQTNNIFKKKYVITKNGFKIKPHDAMSEIAFVPLHKIHEIYELEY